MRLLSLLALIVFFLGATASFGYVFDCDDRGRTGGWSRLDFSEPDTLQLMNEYADIATEKFFEDGGEFPCGYEYVSTIQDACIQVVAGINYRVAYQITCPQMPQVYPLDFTTFVYQPLPGSNETVEVSDPMASLTPTMPPMVGM